ncbi:MAG: CerR family C-terminal domain-containing protein [Desulfobacteraceae bacterium]|nr:CerR family C-terminal domain-containing protein [Desulfobacteraceae bacterium]
MSDHGENTRQRLLEHAEKLFAEKGFAGVSVREITAMAGCNLAAVNYHFGGKQKLYLAVFRERWAKRGYKVGQSFMQAIECSQKPAIEEVVSAMAKAFIQGPLTDSERRIHIQLMQRELSDPGEALDMIVGEVMRPFIRQLTELIEPRIKRGVSRQRLELNILSIIGVTLYFFLARPVVERITGKTYDGKFKSDLVSHITNFSMHGIQALTMEERK